MDIAETAQKLGVSAEQLNSVINGQEGVSPAMAVELSKLFGGGASIWHRLQARTTKPRSGTKARFP